ncbi:DoxX family protein [Streptomyces sp. NPDC092903]|uniref:DoxX family protein n=1 Tax=Streptomyces sp. NPDC092903 TaxID=3366017 RepID=UPI0037F72051
MAVLRRIARPLLAAPFITEAGHALRSPRPLAAVTASRARQIGITADDPERLVRINAAVQIAAGGALALGRFPRTASLVLAASLVPTTLAEHARWKEEEDPELRKDQRFHLARRVGLFGALLLAAADTHGKPSAAYRARAAGHTGRKKARGATARAGGHLHSAIETVGASTSDALSGAGRAVNSAAGSARAILPDR